MMWRLSPVPSPEKATLSRAQILHALEALCRELQQQDATGELCLFGGTVMVLAFHARVSTKDVDAIFQPAPLLREAARRVAESLELPPDWRNDGVKGFVSEHHQVTAAGLPQFPNLRLTMLVPEYLPAMKCMASRPGGTEDGGSDVADILFLIRHLGLTTAESVLEIVARYYPASRIPIKTQYLVEGIFEEGLPCSRARSPALPQ